MKKLFSILAAALLLVGLNAQTVYPYVQRSSILTSGRVPFSGLNGIVTDSSAFTFNSGTGILTATGFAGAVTGNSTTATALQNVRTIGGSNFDGTANVTSFPSPGTIGGSTPAAATFTTLLGTTLNGNTFTTGTYTLTGTAAKTLNFTNTLTLSGTDSTTMTFPSTSATVARTDAANTFTGASSTTSWAETTPVITGGLTASGSGANTFVGSSGTFITSTGANTLSGATTINDATTPSLTTASGKTNTGFVQINGKTSGALKFLPVDASAQTVTVSLAAQTTGASTLTIPDQAGTSRTFAFIDKAQTFTGIQSFTSPDITTSITTPSTSFTAFAGATTLMTIGGTGASASSFFPSTLDATSSVTGAIRTSGGLSAAKAGNIGTTLTVGTSIVSPIFSSNNADPADAGIVRLGNAELIAWEASPASTDVTLTVNSAEQFAFSNDILSPSLATSLVTSSSTFALLNTAATTVNAFGAATTLNFGASATQILNFGGSTTASEFRFLEPSGSGTNYTAFKGVAQSANITYSLPATVGASGTVLTDAAGNGVLSWVAAGAGTVTVVGAGSLTSTALVTGGGSATLQTPSATATMDSSGNISTPGTLTVGNAATTAGAIAITQGTTQSTGTTNITIQAPTAVTSYIRTLPGAVGSTGFLLETVSGSVQTESLVAATGTGSVALGTSPSFTTNFTLANGTAPTTSSVAQMAFDTNAWATSFGAVQVYNGTASTYLVGAEASDTPTNGQVPTWNTGGTITWETPAGSATLASTQVGYGSAGNALTGEAAFTYTAASNTLGVDTIQLGATGVNITNDTDGAITFLGTSTGSDEDMTINLDDTANTWALSSSTGVTTMALGAIGITTTGTNSIGPLVDSVDGTTPLNTIIQTVAAGTAYTLTTSYASVDFGTTDPVLTIANAGTYSVYVDVQTQLSSATITTQSVSFKLRRTNNTAADLTGATFGQPFPVQTVGSELGPSIHIGPIKYTTTNTDDSITVQGILSASLGAGTATVSACTITAMRAY